MAKRKLSPTEQLRMNIKRTVKSMESRGYRIPSEMKEKIETGKYQTLKSIQNKQYNKLYKEATAEIDGDIVSGLDYRKYERKHKQSANKKAQERATTSIFETARKAQDEIDLSIVQAVNEGQIIYDNILDLVNRFPTKGSTSLKAMLKSEIKNYGERAVLESIAKSPVDVIAMAQNIIFYKDDADDLHSAFLELHNVITGTIPDADEAKEMGDLLDEM